LPRPGLQNIVTAIDPRRAARPSTPTSSRRRQISSISARRRRQNFQPASYDAASQLLIVPLNEACMDMFPVPGGGGGGGLSSGMNWGIRPIPGSDGNYGRLEAIDLGTREVVWRVRQRAPQSSGVLATAGGIVFAGALDRFVRAYDSSNGRLLWEQRLNDVSSSSPMTYSLDGRQYVAVVVGQGGFHAASYAASELKSPPDRGAAIWVFALPKIHSPRRWPCPLSAPSVWAVR
jgi:alcohol dehydrogenase (cytochrome c)